MSAREIFYSQAPAPAAAPRRTLQARKKTAQPARTPSTRNGEESAASTPDSQPSTSVSSVVRAPVMNAASHPGRALGLRYTLVKVSGGTREPVDSKSTFHSGDRIRLNVEVNDGSYLYVFTRGASGTWSPLFPSKDVDDGSNRVEPGRTYEVPAAGHVFTFREPSGTERLFVVVSREPEPSLERLMYAVNGGPSAPAQAPPAENAVAKVLMASAQPIGDDTVGGLRAYARDLIVEDASQAPSSPADAAASEKSVYVVNPTGSADSRVVADISLNHQ